ncbi:MAG: META domain-containing protein [Bacteroidales bacterium]|nr:META domain-containing protein [Bacteroidales bacterium]
MKNIKIIIIFCIIILASSCEKNSNNENEVSCFQVDLNDAAKYQINRKWIFLGFLHKDTQVEECKPDNLEEMNIEFSDTDRFHANSSCNLFNGYYSVFNPDSIIIDSVITTLMYCINDTVREWEDKYFYELRNATNYEISGNSLTIATTSNIDMIFKAD